MGIFSVSDIIISATLLINALALVSGKTTNVGAGKDIQGTGRGSLGLNDMNMNLSRQQRDNNNDDEDEESRQSLLGQPHSSNGNNIGNDEIGLNATRSPGPSPSPSSAKDRLRSLFFGIRKYSCVIVFWNLIFFVLMIGVLPG